eukprot:scaffold214888_cov17-Prasinocladus_malaysianus.AAC.1
MERHFARESYARFVQEAIAGERITKRDDDMERVVRTARIVPVDYRCGVSAVVDYGRYAATIVYHIRYVRGTVPAESHAIGYAGTHRTGTMKCSINAVAARKLF